MFPQMLSALLNWGSPVTFEVMRKDAVDFETVETALDTKTVEMVLTTMDPRKVERKPEGERKWKWWAGVSTESLQEDTVLLAPDGIQYRVDSKTDWSQAGFYLYDLVEQPRGLGNNP